LEATFFFSEAFGDAEAFGLAAALVLDGEVLGAVLEVFFGEAAGFLAGAVFLADALVGAVFLAGAFLATGLATFLAGAFLAAGLFAETFFAAAALVLVFGLGELVVFLAAGFGLALAAGFLVDFVVGIMGGFLSV